MARDYGAPLVLGLLLGGCGGSLVYYADGEPLPEDTATDEPIDSETDADTDADSDTDTDADTDADSDTDADTDTDSDADTDADTDSDADTDTGTPPPPGATLDGTYFGTIEIDYESLVPLFGGRATCTADLTLTVDQTLPTHIYGTYTGCQWPGLALFVGLLGIDEPHGDITGNITSGVAGGWTYGQEDSGLSSWNVPWTGTATTNTISGTFTDFQFLTHDLTGTFDVTWIGP